MLWDVERFDRGILTVETNISSIKDECVFSGLVTPGAVTSRTDCVSPQP